MILTLRGTPYLYQGDELGMTNFPFKKLAEYDDIEVHNAYKEQVGGGQMTEEEFLARTSIHARDNSRTPMQWTGGGQAGFTTANHSWLAINPNYTTVNAAQQIDDPDSIYRYTQRVIALHHSSKAFVYGNYADLDPQNAQVFAYTRTLGDERFLVVLNWSKQATTYTLPKAIPAKTLILTNLPGKKDDVSTMHLAPWEARIYKF